MEKFVINIGRQLGSGGRTVGEIIARRLGVRLYDKELINLAARESGICPEFFEKADEKESRGVISTVVGYLRAPFVGDDGGRDERAVERRAVQDSERRDPRRRGA